MIEPTTKLISGIVCWQPVLTDHQAYTLEAFGRVAEASVVIFSTKREDAVRREQGWLPVSEMGMCHEMIPAAGWYKFACAQLRHHKNSIHVFGSPFEDPKLIVALFLAALFGVEFYLISEPFSPVSYGYLADEKKFVNWIKRKLRPFLYQTYGSFLRNRVAGIFAISPLAVTQYLRTGVPARKLFPFGYFVPSEKSEIAEANLPFKREDVGLKVVFVGSLIARKGVGELIEAVQLLRDQGFHVIADAFGPGDASTYSVGDASVRFCGRIAFGRAQGVIGSYDVLVLPSRFDGWGVVVNEALMAGVPVVCTDQAGSSALVKKWRCGKTYNASDVGALVSILKALMANREELVQMKVAASHASSLLEPIVAGKYMLEAIRNVKGLGPKPSCPWYDL